MSASASSWLMPRSRISRRRSSSSARSGTPDAAGNRRTRSRAVTTISSGAFSPEVGAGCRSAGARRAAGRSWPARSRRRRAGRGRRARTSAIARFAARLLFPTPPLPLANAIVRTCGRVQRDGWSKPASGSGALALDDAQRRGARGPLGPTTHRGATARHSRSEPARGMSPAWATDSCSPWRKLRYRRAS